MRRDDDHAYVTDAFAGALTVIDLKTGEGRRLLGNHPKMKADPSITPVVEGIALRQRDGSPVIINVNLLEISNDRAWIYFMPLFGPWLRRIRTKDLNDTSLDEEQLGSRIEDVVKVPPCAGIAADKHGNLFLSSFTEFAIRKLKPDLSWETVVTDPRVCCPNEGEVGADGYLYFPASQFARGGQFQPNGVARYQLPFELLKVKVA
jgi:sugar lactone lactonase YvrE